jgi:hypothetical protein
MSDDTNICDGQIKHGRNLLGGSLLDEGQDQDGACTRYQRIHAPGHRRRFHSNGSREGNGRVGASQRLGQCDSPTLATPPGANNISRGTQNESIDPLGILDTTLTQRLQNDQEDFLYEIRGAFGRTKMTQTIEPNAWCESLHKHRFGLNRRPSCHQTSQMLILNIGTQIHRHWHKTI